MDIVEMTVNYHIYHCMTMSPTEGALSKNNVQFPFTMPKKLQIRRAFLPSLSINIIAVIDPAQI